MGRTLFWETFRETAPLGSLAVRSFHRCPLAQLLPSAVLLQNRKVFAPPNTVLLLLVTLLFVDTMGFLLQGFFYFSLGNQIAIGVWLMLPPLAQPIGILLGP